MDIGVWKLVRGHVMKIRAVSCADFEGHLLSSRLSDTRPLFWSILFSPNLYFLMLKDRQQLMSSVLDWEFRFCVPTGARWYCSQPHPEGSQERVFKKLILNSGQEKLTSFMIFASASLAFSAAATHLQAGEQVISPHRIPYPESSGKIYMDFYTRPDCQGLRKLKEFNLPD